MSTLIFAGKIAGTAALTLGGLVTGMHLSTADTPAPASTSVSTAAVSTAATTATCHPRAVTDAKVRAALEAARKQPKGDARKAALAKVHKAVRAGDYGAAAKSAAAERRSALKAAHKSLVKSTPDEMRAALKAARQEPKGKERRAADAQILKDAAAGKYGDGGKKVAAARQDRRDACQAEHKERRAKVRACVAATAPSAKQS